MLSDIVFREESESGHPGADFGHFGTENFPNPIFKKETRFLVKSLGGYTFSKPDFPKLGHQLGPPGGTIYPSRRGNTLLQIAPPGGAKPYSEQIFGLV